MQYELKFVKQYCSEGTIHIIIFARQEGRDYYELFKNPIFAKSRSDLTNKMEPNNLYYIYSGVDCRVAQRLIEYGLICETGRPFTYMLNQRFLDSMPTTSEFFAMNIYKFHIGDFVDVIDNGYAYISYNSWQGLNENYSENYISSLPVEGHRYKILNLDMHGSNFQSNKILVLIQDIITSKVFIIGVEGIRH